MQMFIDDLREPATDGWIIVRTSAEALDHMQTHGCPARISFDHDLGGDDTAMVVVKAMIEHDLDCPGFIPADFSFVIHSANPVGAKNIAGLLNSYLVYRKGVVLC